jgi:hypothetical protein
MERLNLTLFVNTQHKRVIGRVKIKPHDIAPLFDEERIGGKLESAPAMGLNGKSLKKSVIYVQRTEAKSSRTREVM